MSAIKQIQLSRSVIWFKAENELPDDEETVLMALDDGEVWTGYHDAGEWPKWSGGRAFLIRRTNSSAMSAAIQTPEFANDAQRGTHWQQRLVGHSESKTHKTKILNELHLFAGGGGGILGGILLGHIPVCAVEINERCRKVLLARQRDEILPWFPVWDDVRTFDGTPWRGIADIVAGGFPCQDISTAGKGDGLDGQRSGLWKEMARVVREVRPSYVFVENSPALTSRGLGRILGELATMGYDAEWCVLGADSAGAPHRRERLWLLAANADAGIVRTSRPLQNQGRTANLHLCRPRRTGQMETPWSILAEPCSVAYGMAGLVDELRPYGNGQVPVVAASAWRILEAQLRMPNDKLSDGGPVSTDCK